MAPAAASTTGTFLRAFTAGHLGQLDAVQEDLRLALVGVRDPQRLLVAASGVLGPLLLVVYFGAPLLVSPLANVLYAAHPPTDQVVAVGRTYHDLLFLGTWFQATGALLSVVFFLGLAHMAGATTRLAGTVLVMGAAVLPGVVVAEGVFTLTWATAAAASSRAPSRRSPSLSARPSWSSAWPAC